MSVLSDTAIRAAMKDGRIRIDPFREQCLGPNSYDLHLGDRLLTYGPNGWTEDENSLGAAPAVPTTILDCARENPTWEIKLGQEGYLLLPGHPVLAVTMERVDTHQLVPWLDGRSGAGRLFLSVHTTAGRGDVGFCGYWTMELSAQYPTRIYVGMRIAQMTWLTVEGEVDRPYTMRPGTSYAGSALPVPVPSRIHERLFD